MSTYGAVLTIYTVATGSDEYKSLGIQALNFVTYALNNDGCPCEQAGYVCRGGAGRCTHR